MWRSLLKSNAAYAAGVAANSVALFLLIPFLVNMLPPEDYGAWALLEIVILFLNLVMVAGLDVGLMRHYWYLQDETGRASLVGTVLIAVTSWGGILFVIGLLTFNLLPFDSPDTAQNLLWVLAICLLEAIFAIFLTLFRIREQAPTFAALSVTRMIIFLATAIWLVYAGGGVNGALMGRFLGALVATAVALIIGFRHIRLTLNLPMLRVVLRYGLPLLPTGIATYILFAADRLILKETTTLEVVAIYTFAYKLATTLDIVITRPFALDWGVRRFKLATRSDAAFRYAQILVIYLLAMVTFALLLLAFTPALYAWFAPAVYQQGMYVVPVIILAYIVYGLSFPLNIGMMLKDKTAYIPVISWLAAILCIGLNLWLIPEYGMSGAAWATVVAYAVFTAGIALLSQKIYPVKHHFGRIGVVVLAGLAGGIGLWVVDRTIGEDGKLWATLFAKAIALLPVFIVLVYVAWQTVQIRPKISPEPRLEEGSVSA